MPFHDNAGSIAIAGAGRVAQALGRLLRERGECVAAIAARSPERAGAAAEFIGGNARAVPLDQLPAVAGRILIAVSDTALPAVADQLAAAGMTTGLVLHTCGARGPEALAPLAAAGVSCAVLHPLQTVATVEQGLQSLPGSAFAISGDVAAAGWARQICSLLDGTALVIPPDSMPAYHAAAVMASNYLIGLIDAAVILMKAAGIEEKTALGALGPLVRATTENALGLGPGDALTGPIERGDVETVRRHLGSLGTVSRSAAELYRCAGLHVVDLARRRGLDGGKAREIEALLRERR